MASGVTTASRFNAAVPISLRQLISISDEDSDSDWALAPSSSTEDCRRVPPLSGALAPLPSGDDEDDDDDEVVGTDQQPIRLKSVSSNASEIHPAWPLTRQKSLDPPDQQIGQLTPSSATPSIRVIVPTSPGDAVPGSTSAIIDGSMFLRRPSSAQPRQTKRVAETLNRWRSRPSDLELSGTSGGPGLTGMGVADSTGLTNEAGSSLMAPSSENPPRFGVTRRVPVLRNETSLGEDTVSLDVAEIAKRPRQVAKSRDAFHGTTFETSEGTESHGDGGRPSSTALPWGASSSDNSSDDGANFGDGQDGKEAYNSDTSAEFTAASAVAATAAAGANKVAALISSAAGDRRGSSVAARLGSARTHATTGHEAVERIPRGSSVPSGVIGYSGQSLHNRSGSGGSVRGSSGRASPIVKRVNLRKTEITSTAAAASAAALQEGAGAQRQRSSQSSLGLVLPPSHYPAYTASRRRIEAVGQTGAVAASILGQRSADSQSMLLKLLDEQRNVRVRLQRLNQRTHVGSAADGDDDLLDGDEGYAFKSSLTTAKSAPERKKTREASTAWSLAEQDGALRKQPSNRKIGSDSGTVCLPSETVPSKLPLLLPGKALIPRQRCNLPAADTTLSISGAKAPTPPKRGVSASALSVESTRTSTTANHQRTPGRLVSTSAGDMRGESASSSQPSSGDSIPKTAAKLQSPSLSGAPEQPHQQQAAASAEKSALRVSPLAASSLVSARAKRLESIVASPPQQPQRPQRPDTTAVMSRRGSTSRSKLRCKSGSTRRAVDPGQGGDYPTSATQPDSPACWNAPTGHSSAQPLLSEAATPGSPRLSSSGIGPPDSANATSAPATGEDRRSSPSQYCVSVEPATSQRQISVNETSIYRPKSTTRTSVASPEVILPSQVGSPPVQLESSSVPPGVTTIDTATARRQTARQSQAQGTLSTNRQSAHIESETAAARKVDKSTTTPEFARRASATPAAHYQGSLYQQSRLRAIPSQLQEPQRQKTHQPEPSRAPGNRGVSSPNSAYEPRPSPVPPKDAVRMAVPLNGLVQQQSYNDESVAASSGDMGTSKNALSPVASISRTAETPAIPAGLMEESHSAAILRELQVREIPVLSVLPHREIQFVLKDDAAAGMTISVPGLSPAGLVRRGFNLHKINSGTFCCVYRAKCRGVEVAVKCPDEKLLKSDGDMMRYRALQEWKILSRTSHSKILNFYGGVVLRDQIWLVTDYIPGGDLYTLLYHRPPEYLRPKVRLSLMEQLADAVAYLHNMSPRVAHKDLKCNNLLVGENLRLRVCDFGDAEELHGKHLQCCTAATWQYTPPELIGTEDPSRPKNATEKIDVWAIGCVYLEILRCSTPFMHILDKVAEDRQREVLRRHFLDGRLEAECRISIRLPPRIRALIKSCLSFDQDLRPSATELLRALRQHREALFVEICQWQAQWENAAAGNGRGALLRDKAPDPLPQGNAASASGEKKRRAIGPRCAIDNTPFIEDVMTGRAGGDGLNPRVQTGTAQQQPAAQRQAVTAQQQSATATAQPQYHLRTPRNRQQPATGRGPSHHSRVQSADRRQLLIDTRTGPELNLGSVTNGPSHPGNLGVPIPAGGSGLNQPTRFSLGGGSAVPRDTIPSPSVPKQFWPLATEVRNPGSAARADWQLLSLATARSAQQGAVPAPVQRSARHHPSLGQHRMITHVQSVNSPRLHANAGPAPSGGQLAGFSNGSSQQLPPTLPVPSIDGRQLVTTSAGQTNAAGYSQQQPQPQPQPGYGQQMSPHHLPYAAVFNYPFNTNSRLGATPSFITVPPPQQQQPQMDLQLSMDAAAMTYRSTSQDHQLASHFASLAPLAQGGNGPGASYAFSTGNMRPNFSRQGSAVNSIFSRGASMGYGGAAGTASRSRLKPVMPAVFPPPPLRAEG